jgi:protein SCO1/2
VPVTGTRIFTAVVAAALLATLAAGCGSGASSPDATTASAASFKGAVAKPAKPVPPLQLEDSVGHPVNIDDYRGKAVLVTFIYTHCPDVCPIIVGNLHTAQAKLGPEAKNLQIIAVSVDPKGDTPKTVNAFLKDHQMTGRMEYLVGSRAQLERTWKAWGIASRVPKSNPDLVEHSAEIFGISGSGKVTTLYPANFSPNQIVHDVPILAAQ